MKVNRPWPSVLAVSAGVGSDTGPATDSTTLAPTTGCPSLVARTLPVSTYTGGAGGGGTGTGVPVAGAGVGDVGVGRDVGPLHDVSDRTMRGTSTQDRRIVALNLHNTQVSVRVNRRRSRRGEPGEGID